MSRENPISRPRGRKVNDRIAYVVYFGDEEGRAFWSEDEAKTHIGQSSAMSPAGKPLGEIRKEIVELRETKTAAYDKLTAVERLVTGVDRLVTGVDRY